MNLGEKKNKNKNFSLTAWKQVRGLYVVGWGEVGGWLVDREAGGSVYTSLGQDPVGAMGWECLEKLWEERTDAHWIGLFVIVLF